MSGGGKVALVFAKDGYIGAQRVVLAPRQDYGKVDDVVLLKPDSVVTVVRLGGAMTAQIAQGSISTDVDGARHATVMFDTGTVASMRLPDGTTQPVSMLSVRLTEFTVNPTGRAAMPAPLPPSRINWCFARWGKL